MASHDAAGEPPLSSHWLELLRAERVALPKLRRLVAAGCSEDKRPLAWAVLLGVLDTDPSTWDAAVKRKLENYQSFVAETVTAPFMDAKALGAAVGTLLHQAIKLEDASVGKKAPSAGTGTAAGDDDDDADADADDLDTGDGAGGAGATPLPEGGAVSPASPAAATSPPGDSLGDDPASAAAASAAPAAAAEDSASGATAARDSASQQVPALTHPLMDLPSAPVAAAAAASPTPSGPAAPSPGGRAASAAEDVDILRDDVRKDVVRTHGSLSFFQRRASVERMCRLLYVYGRLNSGIKYVQGMNELMAPIFWVCCNSPLPGAVAARARGEEWTPIGPCPRRGDGESPSEAVEVTAQEALAFFIFSNLMLETMDLYTKRLDNSKAGINTIIVKFGTTLRRADPKLHAHLHELGIDPRFFGYRWFTTLLAREFELPDTLRLWDTLLADPKRFGQLFYSCVAMVYCLRKKLLACDFSRTLMTLQEYGEQMVDVERIIDTAAKIRVWDTREGSGVTLVKGVPTHPDDDAIVAALGEAGVVPGTGGSGGTGTRRSSAASTSSASSLSLLGAATGRMFGLARGLAQTGARRLSAALSAPVPAAAVLAQPADQAPAAAPAQAAPSPARASRSSRPALGPGTMVVTPIDEGAGDDDEEGTGESAEDALCATPSEDAGGAHNPFATPPPSPSPLDQPSGAAPTS
ncbi:hypothetical protein FNF27_01096 [Cafeteria roenbergensis]|uniref:Rab-GAP TBC domain-containing protein n=2 Tax=Cafeteria roenbergensis TaxID=33653 RepID=A0A5A8EJF2_CAFRO|nr:hypothetical protein FNF27_01096 [Cafeteria roenbergensis]